MQALGTLIVALVVAALAPAAEPAGESFPNIHHWRDFDRWIVKGELAQAQEALAEAQKGPTEYATALLDLIKRVGLDKRDPAITIEEIEQLDEMRR
ncbi:MAG: hypothetical protein EKK55_22650 [Rhodocyclaceae bacterium]|nr:MAG: hypothetical protein EKK55_22650 [Rhodocyclaceae bacterium]